LYNKHIIVKLLIKEDKKMSSRDFIPAPEAQFNIWQANFIEKARAVAESIGIPTQAVTAIVGESSKWKTVLEIATNPATRTSSAIKDKQEQRITYEAELRKFIRSYITNNPLVTDHLRKDMELPIHKTTHTPAPVATEAPDVDIDTSVIGRLIIHFFEKGGKHKKNKPEGQHGVEIRWIISDTHPSRWDDLTHSEIDTNSPHTLVFENDERGKTIYFALRWENTRGEKGPWSEISSAIIP
jgi:hypothetical protein